MDRARRTRVVPAVVAALLVASFAASGCGGTAATGREAPGPDPAAAAPAAPAPEVREVTFDDHGHPVGIHNYHAWSDRIGAGAQPEGEEAFRNLAALGYRVLVSVDGARPDVELAQKYGLRYVHIPIGYDGIDDQQRLEIARAVQVAGGRVFLHCHHGKHRGPAAAAVALVASAGMSNADAVLLLETSGTDPKYKGLYAAARTCRAPSPEELARIPADLPSWREPGDLAAVMVDVDLRWEHLAASKDASWKVPEAHPDVDPPHEARMLWEHYAEIARKDEAKALGAKFLKHLTEAEAAARSLDAALRAGDAEAANAAHARSKKACSSCHTDFRDN